MQLRNLSIFCADVDSIKQKKFGWAASYPDGSDSPVAASKNSQLMSCKLRNQRKLRLDLNANCLPL